MESAQRTRSDPAAPRVPGGVGAARPLSFAQERLWWFEEVAPTSSIVTMAMHLRGALRVAALEQMLDAVVQRHPLLRARFRVDRGAPVQEVLAAVDVDIPVVDLQNVRAAERQDVAERLLYAAAGRALDLTSPPLLRPQLFRLAPDHHILLIRLSHLVVDEWSRQLLMQDLAALYSASSRGEPSRLPPLNVQYGDYALWERAQHDDERTEKHLAFWETYLADVPALVELPADRPRPPRRAYCGAWRSRHLEPGLGDRVHALARAEGLTPFQVLLATFFMLVARQTGAADLTIGTPFSRRPDERYARVIGPFLNSLVVRADCRGDQLLRDFLRHVRSRMAAAAAHAQVPFERVVDRLQLERDASYNPLVQLWFIYKPRRASETQWDGFDAVPIEMHETVMPFDLTLVVSEGSVGLECVCTYDTALFEAETVDRLLEQFERVLLGATAQPGRSIGEYDLLSAEQEQRQLVAWNQTATAWPSPACVHEAIMSAAARTPDAIAITSDEGQMSYAALAGAARELAGRLRRAGVSVESRVGVVMERSIDLVVALVGTLEAGGAVLPLDPDASPERMMFVLRDADAACVVTSRALRGRVSHAGRPIVVIDDIGEPSGAGADVRSAAPLMAGRRATGANLCYVLYTSGTTGEPKGVAVTHASVMNVLQVFGRALGVGPADVVLGIAAITFDIAMLEMFLPLITGARIVVAPGRTSADGAGLRARVAKDGVTILQATPATWRLLLDAGWQPAPGTRLVSGAEPLPPELARQLVATAGHVWNCYGPTETTIYSTLERIDAPAGPITIGRPMANTSIYVLDPNHRPVPVGVRGEIYIGGDGLARGYLGRPGLTAAAFRPDPYSASPGGRMYASADLARHLPDGRIVCDGRRDRQVKLYGRRIELEAISHVLDAHPLVRNSVAALRDTETHGKCLVAYVAVIAPGQLERAALREHLARHLPPYMLPAAIVLLDALPRTRRDKLDIRALPAPVESDFRAALALIEPRTPAEEGVAAVWREVLATQHVGVEDDFFALGGNSLQVTRVLQLIRTRLGVELGVQTFFEAPTVAALAGQVEHHRHLSPAARDATVARVPRDGELELAPQQENWWYNEILSSNIHPNNVHLSVRFTGPLHSVAMEQAVALLQQRHEALRTAFVAREQEKAAILITPPEVCQLAVAQVDLSQMAPAAHQRALEWLSRQEKGRPFDLTRGALCRVVLVRLGDEDHVLLFTTHHLVFDEWSMDILMRDISTFYASIREGTPPQLPPLAFQYVDFARWQRDWLSTPNAARQFAYWRRRLAPPLPALLPVREETLALSGSCFSVRGRVPFVIGEEAADAARSVSRAERCTLFSTIMTAVKLVLYAHSRQPDIRVGTLMANRGLPGAEQVVGLFTNVVCVRTHVEATRSFRDLLRTVHASIAAATAHQDLPFEVLVQDLFAAQPASRDGLLHAMVVWLAMPSPESMRFPDVSTSAYRVEEDATDSLVLARNSLDLRWELMEGPAVVTGSVTYSLTEFSVIDIHAMVDRLEQCLTLAGQDPDMNVEALCGHLSQRQATTVDAAVEAHAR